MGDSSRCRVREIENAWIPLADGIRLAARIWLPEDAQARPVPAILEYLPYRKDDCTARGDATRHPYFAAHGYAAVRVDLRGTGDSDGLLLGEYLEAEQDDGVEVLEWLADQPWCTGDVGMIGYSWGGFNGLQMAARRPPQLKAIVTHASTDDRYLDDCHYMGGCLLASDMLKWAASMLTYPIQPPDPRFVGERWREVWLRRLENAPELARDWIAHQRRDAFWKHGSVAEDYAAIECAVFAVGGWADAYTNAVLRLLENLTAPSIGLIGPWAHMMPNVAVPGPAIGFLHEVVRWFDQWLKGIDTGVMREPRLRVWMQEYVPPTRSYEHRPGRWVGLEQWPSAGKGRTAKFRLAGAGGLVRVPDGEDAAGEEPLPGDAGQHVSLLGRQECGETAGVWCANGMGDELPGDQRPDDERSIAFTSGPVAERLEVLGRPVCSVRVRVDRPLALVAALLEDVAPGGESLLVSWGMLNLAHRDSHETPEPLVPGRWYDVEVALNACGHVFEPGHRLRLALSPTYWPHAWPSPEPVMLDVSLSGASALGVPLLAGGPSPAAPTFGPPERTGLPPAEGDVARRTREIVVDELTGRHEIVDTQVDERTIAATGARYSESGTDRYTVVEGDPLSAAVHCERETRSAGPDGEWSVGVSAKMTCDTSWFHVVERYGARENGSCVFDRTRTYRIARDML